MDPKLSKNKSLPQTLETIPKLVDYSDTDDSYTGDHLIEGVFVGVKGRKPCRKSKPICVLAKEVKPNPCIGRKCQNNCAVKFSETDRVEINEFYWGLASKHRQNDWLKACVTKREIRRKRVSCSRRKVSYEYSVNFRGEKYKVCQQFLLAMLGISQMPFRYIFAKLKKSQYKIKEKKKVHNKCSEEQTRLVCDFIEKLPAVPSHYCRNKSNKLYLSEELRNVANLYKIYVDAVKSSHQQTLTVSLFIFRKIFKNNYHLGFHSPRKDKCNICEKYKNMNTEASNKLKDSDIYKNHIFDKNKSKEIFLREQAEGKKKESQILCASFDLQKVLNTPYGKSINLFYSRKYAYYNESIYESGTRNGYCFLWGECDGKRGCNEICSILLKYLTIVDNRKQHRVVSLVINRHTMMHVDSVHATIENFIKNRTIWAPSEWASLISNSRTNPKGYECIVLNYTDFQNWKTYSKVFLPHNIKIKFNNLRSVNFDKNKFCAQLKYRYNDDKIEELNLKLIKRTIKNTQLLENGPEFLYSQKLEISTQKFKDLWTLCDKGIIPERYHQEYINMKSDDKNEDVLAESDDDDDYM